MIVNSDAQLVLRGQEDIYTAGRLMGLNLNVVSVGSIIIFSRGING